MKSVAGVDVRSQRHELELGSGPMFHGKSTCPIQFPQVLLAQNTPC